jgi:ABC-type branched-subunit amino acid transport system substrate-binding protein
MADDQGGVWGRKVNYYDSSGNLQPGINVTDDGYQPSKAVVAAQQCQDQQGGDFFLLGGIGFDQIPAVRVWAEQHHMLYLHHIALATGADGLRYSFTMLPALELVGQQFGQYYLAHHAGQKLGIIERNSSNWEAGSTAFKKVLQDAGQGGNIVADEFVQNNQGQYAQEISDLQLKGAQVVLIWENALAAEQIIQQSNQQQYTPYWIGFPFNLTLQTLAQAGVPTSVLQRISGMVPWPAYTCNASKLPQFSAYRQEIEQFEAAYAKYDPNAKLCGVGGDLLFGTWEAWRQVYDLLYQCGRFCTRDKVAGLMLSGYHATVGANCPVDFRGADGHHGGYDEVVYQVQIINGSPAWVSVPPICRRTLD